MNLKSITLENFRNYEKADFLFDPGVNPVSYTHLTLPTKA